MTNYRISFPPLTTAPRWASNKALNTATLHTLYRHALLLYHKLGDASAILATVPGPTREMLQSIPATPLAMLLRTVRSTLREMEYPSDMTSWMNSTRSAAAQAAALFAEGHSILQQLCHFDPSQEEYRDGLDALRRYTAQVMNNIEDLVEQIDDYLRSLEYTDTYYVDSAEADRLSQRSAEWYQGWHSGVREAEALIRDALHRQAGVAAQSEQDFVEEIVERVVSRLQERIQAADARFDAYPL